MNPKIISELFNNYKKLAGLILLISFLAGITYSVSVVLSSRHVQSISDKSSQNMISGLENIKGDWWEAKRFIYHGIPARVVFLIPPDKNISPEDVSEKIWLEFERIGRIFNPFNPDSEIYHLNSSVQHEAVAVSDDIFSVMHISKKLWRDTNGQFDPTMWQIKQLWQSAEKTQQIPDETDISVALQWTGFDKVQVDEKRLNILIFKNDKIKFDFGGIVKGYAVDQVRQLLMELQISDGLVQLGGEICAFGNNNKNPWRIGIQHPKEMDRVWGVISSYDDLRVSTSGNYRQPIQINGKSFYHIFSPKTGKPVSEKVLGVTTASFTDKITNARLDGVATAITVMGPANGLELAKKLKIETVILFEKDDGTIGEFVTSGLKEFYERPE